MSIEYTQDNSDVYVLEDVWIKNSLDRLKAYKNVRYVDLVKVMIHLLARLKPDCRSVLGEYTYLYYYLGDSCFEVIVKHTTHSIVNYAFVNPEGNRIISLRSTLDKTKFL